MTVRLNGATSGYVDLNAPAVAGTSSLTLPTGTTDLSAAWTTYTPTLTASGANPTLGTGAVASGRYSKIGRTVTGHLIIRFGTSMAAGTGSYFLSFPVTAASVTPTPIIGQGWVYDNSANQVIVVTALASTTSVFAVYVSATTTYTVAHAAPWAWAESDEIRVSFQYEAAS